jgi:hypothetical protein
MWKTGGTGYASNNGVADPSIFRREMTVFAPKFGGYDQVQGCQMTCIFSYQKCQIFVQKMTIFIPKITYFHTKMTIFIKK